MMPRPSPLPLRPSEIDRLIRQFRSLRRSWSKERIHIPAAERPQFDEIIVHLDHEIAEC